MRLSPIAFFMCASFIASVMGLAAPRAHACSRVIQDATLLSVSGTDFPTNVTWMATPMAVDTFNVWSIRRAGDVEDEGRALVVTFDEDATRFAPPEELEPNTAYELVLTRELDPSEVAPGEDATLVQRVIPFTTSDGVDNDAPSAPVVARNDTEAIQWNPFGTSCGPVNAATVARFFVERTDDMQYVKLERVDGEEVVFARAEVVSTTDPELFLADIADDESGLHDYRITAFDSAGNASEPTIVATDLGCPGSCATTTGIPAAGLGFVLLLLGRRKR